MLGFWFRIPRQPTRNFAQTRQDAEASQICVVVRAFRTPMFVSAWHSPSQSINSTGSGTGTGTGNGNGNGNGTGTGNGRPWVGSPLNSNWNCCRVPWSGTRVHLYVPPVHSEFLSIACFGVPCYCNIPILLGTGMVAVTPTAWRIS